MMSFRGGTYTFAGSKYNQSQFAIDGTIDERRRRRDADRPARQLHRVVQGSEDRSGEQQRRDRPVWGRSRLCRSPARTVSTGAVFDYYQSPIFRVKNPFSMRAGGGRHSFPRPGARRPGGDSAALRWPRPHLLVRVGRDRQRQFGVGRSEPDGPARAWRRGDFSALGHPDSQPADRRGLRRRPNPAVSAQSGGAADPGAVLSAAEHRQHHGADAPTTIVETVDTRRDRSRTTRPPASITTSATTTASSRGSPSTRRPTRCGRATCRRSAMREQLRQNKALTFSYTRILGPSLVNELRYGHAYNNNPISGPIQRPRSRRIARAARSGARACPTSAGSSKSASPAAASPGCRRSTGPNPGIPQSDQSDPGSGDVAARHAQPEVRGRDPARRLGGAGRAGEPVRHATSRSIHRGAASAATRTPTSCSACRTPRRARFRRCPRCRAAGPTTSSCRTTGRSGAT